MSYLTENQVASILQTAHFSSPFTETKTNYSLYRGRTNTTVLTLRFNLSGSNEFHVTTVHNILLQKLRFHFPTVVELLTSVDYDLLLKDASSTTSSYYIWKANSNRHQFDQSRESMLAINAPSVYRFVEGLYLNDIDQLNIFFSNSNVIVLGVLAIVCSFMPNVS